MNQQLDSNIDAEVQNLKDSLGPQFQGEVLGYAVMYSVGADWNCIVPRNWLLQRVEDLDIPDYLVPGQVCGAYAYNRAMQWMEEQWIKPYSFDIPHGRTGELKPHRVEVDMLDGDGHDLKHFQARVFFSEDEIGEPGGKWITHRLGYVTFDRDNDIVLTRRNEKIDNSKPLMQIWNDITETAREYFDVMSESHISRDIRNMMYHAITKHSTKVIQLQRSIYLFPAGMSDFVESMSTLYSDIDANFKTTREPVAIRTMEVLNTQDKREWIEFKVEETLRMNIDRIMEEAFEGFDEGETAKEVVESIQENLSDQEDTASTYNSLLQTRIDVQERLEAKKASLADKNKQRIIDAVLGQTEIEDF